MLNLSPDVHELDGASDAEIAEWADAATERETPVQVKLTLKGEWHRPLARRGTTACGQALGGYATRDDSYEGELCKRGCFSQHEFDLAAEEAVLRALLKVREQQAENEAYDRERDELEAARRRRTGEIEPARKG